MEVLMAVIASIVILGAVICVIGSLAIIISNEGISGVFGAIRELFTKQKRNSSTAGTKSKIAAAILAFFLGITGAHRYYLGYKKQGMTQTLGFVSLIAGWYLYFTAILEQEGGILLVTGLLLLFGGVVGLWAFVDFIRILTGGLQPANGTTYSENQPQQVQVIQTAPSANDNIDAIEKLAKLHEQGILTDEEFQQKKADLLTKM